MHTEIFELIYKEITIEKKGIDYYKALKEKFKDYSKEVEEIKRNFILIEQKISRGGLK